ASRDEVDLPSFPTRRSSDLAEAHLVDSAEDLRPEWLDGKSRVGVTAGASAPEVLVQAVIDRLQSLGSTVPVELAGRPENVTFSLDRKSTRLNSSHVKNSYAV